MALKEKKEKSPVNNSRTHKKHLFPKGLIQWAALRPQEAEATWKLSSPFCMWFLPTPQGCGCLIISIHMSPVREEGVLMVTPRTEEPRDRWKNEVLPKRTNKNDSRCRLTGHLLQKQLGHGRGCPCKSSRRRPPWALSPPPPSNGSSCGLGRSPILPSSSDRSLPRMTPLYGEGRIQGPLQRC